MANEIGIQAHFGEGEERAVGVEPVANAPSQRYLSSRVDLIYFGLFKPRSADDTYESKPRYLLTTYAPAVYHADDVTKLIAFDKVTKLRIQKQPSDGKIFIIL